ncbi:MAG TPA: ABC transporter permease subunit [Gemmataceae bacterium]|nr:ABC transporter permease subunit [Gemmataceae bacterium]
MITLVAKILRDLRLPLLVVCLLLAAYQCLWAQITERVSARLLPQLTELGRMAGITQGEIERVMFEGPGRILRSLMGGEGVSLFRVTDAMTVSYVHPLTLTILCIWAIGRAASAITGEIDRGTMELLLAQPVPRYRVVLAHLCVDGLTIPLLCLSLWAGNWLGYWLVGVRELDPLTGKPGPFVSPTIFAPALWNVAALVFAMTGGTMWLSARGRFRGRVLGAAVLAALVQFLVNLVGQLWDTVAFLRPFTVFYYYQPQQIILHHEWAVDLASVWGWARFLPPVNVLLVLFAAGTVGYAAAFWSFCRRDLPAPL